MLKRNTIIITPAQCFFRLGLEMRESCRCSGQITYTLSVREFWLRVIVQTRRELLGKEVAEVPHRNK